MLPVRGNATLWRLREERRRGGIFIMCECERGKGRERERNQ
jgi:hypothetical protein